jgi:hypothetical protein
MEKKFFFVNKTIVYQKKNYAELSILPNVYTQALLR